MYRKKLLIHNVNGYVFSNNASYICNKDGNLYKDKSLIINNVDGLSMIVHYDRLFFLSSTDKISYCYDSDLLIIDKPIWVHTVYENPILPYEYNNKLFTIFLYDLKNFSQKTVVEKVDLWDLHRFENIIYFYDRSKKKIKSLSLLTGNYEWEAEFAIQRIVEIIGVFQNSLIVSYESLQNQTFVMAINTATGKMIWEQKVGGMYHFFPLFSKKGDTIVNLHCGSFYLNGVQKAQGKNIFTEINLTDGSFLRHEVLKDLDKVGLGVDKFIVENDYIYFTATYQGSFGAVAIGVLDYNTLQLLWWQQVEMDAADGFGNFLINKPAVGDDKLYVLDKTNVLHIFERIHT